MTNDAVPCRLLTDDSFAPYGSIIQKPERGGDVERDYLSWWGGLYDLDFEEQASLGVLTIKRRPFVVDQLERHIKAVEVFLPLKGVSLMPFADPADINRCEAFIVDGTVGLVIDRGVWHFPPFPVTGEMEFILIVRKDTADDLEIRDIPGRCIYM